MTCGRFHDASVDDPGAPEGQRELVLREVYSHARNSTSTTYMSASEIATSTGLRIQDVVDHVQILEHEECVNLVPRTACRPVYTHD